MTAIGTPDIPELRAAFLMSCHLNGVVDGAEDAFNRALADAKARELEAFATYQREMTERFDGDIEELEAWEKAIRLYAARIRAAAIREPGPERQQ